MTKPALNRKPEFTPEDSNGIGPQAHASVEREPSAAFEEGLPAPQRYYALAAVLTGLVLVVLDSAIANVALPTLTVALQISPSASVWVISGYQLALVVSILPCAALGESLGYRRVYIGGVVVFTLASALCAFAPSLLWLVASRFLQGLGGACIMSLGTAQLRFAFPHRLLGPVIGWNSLTAALAAAAGPTIGALIISVASWPWLFAVNLPVGLAVLVMSRSLPKVPGSARQIDVISILLNAGTFGSLVFAAELMAERPLPGSLLLAAAALCLTLLIRREMPREAPLIPLDLLRRGSFRVSVAASVLCFAAQTAGLIALPFYLQHGLGKDAFTTGLYMTPWPLTLAFAGPFSGRWSNRIETSWLCAIGGICFAIGLALLALWPLQSHLAAIVPFTMISGLGFGFFQVPNNRNMLISAPRERSGAAGGMQATARLTGQTAGALVMTLLFSFVSVETAPRICLAVAAFLALCGGLVSVLRVEREATGS